MGVSGRLLRNGFLVHVIVHASLCARGQHEAGERAPQVSLANLLRAGGDHLFRLRCRADITSATNPVQHTSIRNPAQHHHQKCRDSNTCIFAETWNGAYL